MARGFPQFRNSSQFPANFPAMASGSSIMHAGRSPMPVMCNCYTAHNSPSPPAVHPPHRGGGGGTVTWPMNNRKSQAPKFFFVGLY